MQTLVSPVPRAINQYRPYWAKRFGTSPMLPMSRAEMDALGWDSCDIILVTLATPILTILALAWHW